MHAVQLALALEFLTGKAARYLCDKMQPSLSILKYSLKLSMASNREYYRHSTLYQQFACHFKHGSVRHNKLYIYYATIQMGECRTKYLACLQSALIAKSRKKPSKEPNRVIFAVANCENVQKL